MSPTGIRLWGERIGVAALYVLALSAFVAPAGASAGLGLLALGTLLAPPGPRLLREPALATALLLGLLLVVHTALATALDPGSARGLWDSAGAWLQMLLFVPFAVFLEGDARRLGRLLVLALIGLVAGILWRLDWGLLLHAPDEFLASRPGFGFPPIPFALYSGTGALGLALLARRWWGSGRPTRWTWLRGLAWVLCLALLVEGVILTQSRGAWIAFMLALVSLWMGRRRLEPAAHPTPGRRQALLIGAAAVLTAVALLALNAERIAGRMTSEVGTAEAVLANRPDAPAQSSFSLRWHGLAFGLHRWFERPLLGWGAGASRRLMDASHDPWIKEDGEPLQHLHNSYLEVLVQFGVVGLALLAGMVLLLLRGLIASLRTGELPPDYGRFLLATFVFTLIWSLWDYRAVHQDGRVFWILLAGSAMSFALPKAPSPNARAGGQWRAVPPQELADPGSPTADRSPRP